MRKQSIRAMVLGTVTALLVVYGLFSYGWYSEDRSENLEGREVRESTIDYSLRGVHNASKVKLNDTVLSSEEKVQDYDDFIGVKDTKASQSAARMNLVMIAMLVMTLLFIPTVYYSSEGYLEARLGRIASFLPIIIGQVTALILIISPMWYTYDFVSAINDDMYKITGEPSQALGGWAPIWVVFGGVILQIAVMSALARTKLIYIEPLPGRTEGTE